MRLRSHKYRTVLLLVSFFSLSFSSFLFIGKANALIVADLNNHLPKASDFTGNNVEIVVATPFTGNSLDAPNARVKIYSPSSTLNLTIHRFGHCSYNLGGTDSNTYGQTHYELYTLSGNEDNPNSVWSRNNAHDCTGDVNLAWTSGRAKVDLDKDGVGDYYEFRFEATMMGSGVNGFRLEAGSGVLIGYSNDSSDKFALQNRADPATGLTDFNIPFGSSCDFTQNGSNYRPVRWYDDDWGSLQTDTISPNFRIRIHDDTTGNFVTLYNYDETSTREIGNFVNGDRTIFQPHAGSANPGAVYFLPEEGHHYTWFWHDVANNNGIQFLLPFDSVYHTVDCSKDPVGRFYSLQCDYMVVDAYDQNDGKHIAGSSDGKVVQVKVITGNGTQIQDTSGSSSPGTPYANDVWPGDGWDTGGYAVSNQYNGTGTDSWKDFVDNHLGNTSISLSLYAQDKQTNAWIRVDTATFDATACVPPTAFCSLSFPSLIQPGDSFTITATVTYSPDPPSGATINVNIPGVTTTSGLPSHGANTGGSTIWSWSARASAANSYSTSYSISGTSLGGPCQTIRVVDLPYFKIFGGDIEAGGDFEGTSCINPAGEGKIGGWYNNGSPMYGASTQFAATALGQIIGANSAHGRTPEVSAGLAFANDTANITTNAYSPKLGGNFGSTQCLFNPTLPSATTLNTSSASAGASPLNGDGTFRVPASYTPFTLGSGNFAPPHHITLNVEGDVFVSGNIMYNGDGNWNLNSSATPPSFMVVATGNIYIAPTVTELNGIYMAKGNIYTCATSAGNPVQPPSLYNTCNRQLLVHGSFVARHLNFMRTVGTLNDSLNGGANENRESAGRNTCKNQQLSVAPTQPSLKQCAGEVFDFSPEMYLSEWEIMPEGNGAVQYDSLTSLPPVL